MPVGSRVQKTAGIDGHAFVSAAWCLVCLEYMSRGSDHEDEIYFGDLITEDPEGWEAARAEVEA